jgi:hypothetical protein
VPVVSGSPSAYAHLMVDTGNSNRVYYVSSSSEYKNNIAPVIDDFSKLLTVSAKQWNDKTTGEANVGFIAEDLDNAGLKNLVMYGGPTSPHPIMGIKSDAILSYLVEIVKSQKATIEALDLRIKALENK